VLADRALRERLGRAGEETARHYAWERRIDALEGFMGELARPGQMNRGQPAASEGQQPVA